MTAQTLATPDVTHLLAAAGLQGDVRIADMPGGGNNRVYRLECGGTVCLLKAYFHHPDDPRDRLAAEFSFSRFAWDQGLRCLPEPLARDDQRHLGLYEFLPGRRLRPHEVDRAAVAQAIDFFVELNRHKRNAAAQALPRGSEACFTLAEHLDCVRRRVVRLGRIETAAAVDREAASWIQEKLLPTWQRVEATVLREAEACGYAVDAPLAEADRCLSPSDFGYHNAILVADGRLRFVDFEYAGWDDPAKTACDFLCQPELPVPAELAEPFLAAVVSGLDDAAGQRRRISWLLDVYRIKWCCIMLNEFLPVAGQRRSFALDPDRQEQRKRTQLEKAEEALTREVKTN